MKTTKMMLDYIASCSKTSLQSFELARLNDRANLRKQMIEILDELIEVDVQARIAEWVLVQRQRRERTQPESGAMRRPPQQALRSAALPDARALPQLNPEESADADVTAEISRDPVITTLRESLPEGAMPSAKADAASNSAKSHTVAATPVPACQMAAKSRRIA